MSSTTTTKPTTHPDPSTFELIDLPPSHPQPPSPLLTAAPNSPPFFPFARTPSSSSSSTSLASSSFLSSTLKPLSPNPPTPAATATATATTLPPAPSHRSLPPIGSYPNGKAASHAHNHINPISNNDVKSDDEREGKDDAMPPGYPYDDWRGIGLLAWEYLRGMQGLLLGFMEQDCRWGGARHTI
ncbi:MAG: hypothetical protein LQ344_004563 [Seirophora lacunosa]|nr:MAG: hypothetical protein LQ344_004563 [Seirophora lacunosa]